MTENAPRALLVILIIMVILKLLFSLVAQGVLMLSLVQVAFFVFMGWQALKGKRSAALLVGAGFTLNGLGTLYEIAAISNYGKGTLVILGVLTLYFLGSAAYIFFHPKLKAFYAERAYSF